MFAALELSRKSWLVATSSPGEERISKRTVAAGDGAGLLALLAELREAAERRLGRAVGLVVIQEAGLDGFWLHRLLGLPAPRPTARWRLEPGRLSVKVVAAKLGVKPTWIYNRLRYGLIQFPHDPATGRHAFPDTNQMIDALRRLLAGEVNRVDFSQHEAQ